MAIATPTDDTAAPRPPAPAPPPLAKIAALVKHVALLLALVASAVLYVDHRNAGDPAFCGVASGCFAVRMSGYSHLGGIPLPHLALPAFALLLGGSVLARRPEHHRLVAWIAGLGAGVAAGLIVLQAAVIGAFCPWCVLVDASTIVAGAAAVFLALHVGGSEERAARASVRGAAAAAWAVAGLLAVALPFLWARYPVVPPAPPEIAAEAKPGEVTIVSFTDFECPFCRKLHPMLDDIRERHGDRVHLVRKMKPLLGHPGALPAAKAYVCAPEDKRDAVAAKLYEADSSALTDRKLAALADELDLGGREPFAACLAAESTLAVIERDSAAFAALAGKGLPFTWINARVVLGADSERLVRTVEEELAGPRPALPVAAMFALLGVAALIAAALSWRSPRAA